MVDRVNERTEPATFRFLRDGAAFVDALNTPNASRQFQSLLVGNASNKTIGQEIFKTFGAAIALELAQNVALVAMRALNKDPNDRVAQSATKIAKQTQECATEKGWVTPEQRRIAEENAKWAAIEAEKENERVQSGQPKVVYDSSSRYYPGTVFHSRRRPSAFDALRFDLR